MHKEEKWDIRHEVWSKAINQTVLTDYWTCTAYNIYYITGKASLGALSPTDADMTFLVSWDGKVSYNVTFRSCFPHRCWHYVLGSWNGKVSVSYYVSFRSCFKLDAFNNRHWWTKYVFARLQLDKDAYKISTTIWRKWYVGVQAASYSTIRRWHR